MVPRDSTILLMGSMDSEHEASLHAFFAVMHASECGAELPQVRDCSNF